MKNHFSQRIVATILSMAMLLNSGAVAFAIEGNAPGANGAPTLTQGEPATEPKPAPPSGEETPPTEPVPPAIEETPPTDPVPPTIEETPPTDPVPPTGEMPKTDPLPAEPEKKCDCGVVPHTATCPLYQAPEPPAVPQQPEAVKIVLALMAALPTVDELAAMDAQGEGFAAYLEALKGDVLAARAAYDALTPEEKAACDAASLEKLAALEGALAAMPMVMVAIPLTFTGDGTDASPYLIDTTEDLKALATADSKGKYFKLVNSLDLTGVSWTPIGSSYTTFQGTFDGNHKVISNLTINATDRYCGLFGKVENATIKNLGVENAKVTSSYNDVAILVGNAQGGSIEDCYVTGTIQGRSAVSGILGSTHSSSATTAVKNCYARVKLANSGSTKDVAGISGWNEATSVSITNSYSACIGEIRPIAGWSDGGAVQTNQFVSTYFDKTLSPGFTSEAGRTDLGKTSVELQTQGTFSGWDFTNTWAIDPKKNGGYPYLKGFTPGLGGAPGSITVVLTDSKNNPITGADVKLDTTNIATTPSVPLHEEGHGVYSGTVTTTDGTYYIYVDGKCQPTPITQPGNGAAQGNITVTPPPLTSDKITIKINDAATEYGGASLETAVTASGTPISSITKLTITAGTITDADWTWFKGTYTPIMSALTDFTVDAAVTAVADISNPNSKTRTFPDSIVSVTIPQAIKVSNCAFYSCKSLTTVSLPQATDIGAMAFTSCEKLADVSLPKVTAVGIDAFEFCRMLKTVSLPVATDIGESAFKDCQALTTVSLPKVTTIDATAFKDCKAFAELKLSATPPTTVGINAFQNCLKTTLTLMGADGKALTGSALATAQDKYKADSDGSPADNKWYGWRMAAPVADAITIKINGAATEYGGASLEAAVTASGTSENSITALTITAGEVTADDWKYFAGGTPGTTISPLTVLTTFEISATVTSVANIPNGNHNKPIFPKSIVSVTIPQAITVGKYAFYTCEKLASMSLPKATEIGATAFQSCEALTTVELPAATDIGQLAFDGCTALANVSLPAVTSITGFAFSDCTKLATLKLPATPPYTLNGAFNNCPTSRNLTIVGADGTELTDPTALAKAQKEYDNVTADDNVATDGLWYGWTIGGGASTGHSCNGITFDKSVPTSGNRFPAGNYYLSDDLTVSANLLVDYDTTVNLCLNGHTLTASNPNVGYSSITLRGGSSKLNIYDCSANNSGKITGGSSTNGGCIFNNGTLALYGGTITGNTAARSGGVYNEGTLTLYGKASVTGNTDKSGNSSNIGVQPYYLLKVGNKLSGTIGVTPSSWPDSELSEPLIAEAANGYTITADDLKCFVSDKKGYEFILESGFVKMKKTTKPPIKPAPGGELTAPATQDKVDGVFGEGNATLDGDKITINNDITVNTPIIIKPTPITIDMGDHTITGGAGANPVIKIDNGGTGTITGGGSINGGNGGAGVEVGGGSTVTIGGGTVINGGDSSTGNGGDGITGGGSVVIDGGTATGGTATGGNGSGGDGANVGGDITIGGGGSATGGNGSGTGSGGDGSTSTGGSITIDNGGSATGGNGGTDGGNGGNGSSTGGNTTINSGGTVTGGNGGNASSGTGGAGGTGSTGTGSGSITVGGGVNGGSGGSGAIGGNGGDGTTTDTGNTNISGGGTVTGGTGGNASSGTGGSGGSGATSTGSGGITVGGNTNGGAGGTGTTGGTGGNGTSTGGKTEVSGGGTATGGTGGSGSGTGGNGGNGTTTSNGGTTINGGANGGSGGSGTSGSNGNGGNGGDGAHQGSGTVDGGGTATGGNGGSGAGTGSGGSGGTGVGGGATADGSLTVKNGISAKVEVIGNAPTAVELPDPAKTVDAVLSAAEKTDATITDVKVTLTVNDETNRKPNEAMVEGAKPQNSTVGAFFDIILQKTITKNGAPESPASVTDTHGQTIEIVMTIPENMRDGSHYTVIRVHGTTAEALPTTQDGITLRFGTDKFSTYAIAYTKGATPPPPTDNTGGGSDNDEYDFWMRVQNKINSADSGDVIKVSANYYDKMPESVMEVLRKNSGVTLVISWSGGETITIPAGKAAKQESGRIYYPLSLLAERYKGMKLVEGNPDNPETGGPSYIAYADGNQIPVTGGIIQLVPPLAGNTPNAVTPKAPASITPPTAGFEGNACAEIPDSQRAAGHNGVWFAVIVAMLAGCGCLWIAREEDE